MQKFCTFMKFKRERMSGLNNKLGIGIINSVQIKHQEQLLIFKETGFDAFFSNYSDDTAQLRKIANEIGLEYQSIHAPFEKMRHMWYPSKETDIAKQELKECIADAAKYSVPIVVMHPFIGFDINESNDFGVQNFKEIVDYAKDNRIKIAFENVEGDSYLEALMSAFKTYENVGFCWDTGHEMCYNRHKDMLLLYGDKLIATHINDNIGVSGDEITFFDDLHLIPFDGIKDWQDAMNRLDMCGYNDILTFELVISKDRDAKGGTHYFEMEFVDYIKKVYEAGKRLIGMRCPGL